MRIALDAMGGDDAPGPNIAGAIAGLREHPDWEVLLVGDVPTLEPLLADVGDVRSRLILHPADGWVAMDEKPVEALRKKPNCSISVCWQLMAGRQVDAVVSAGHTGAVVAAGLRTRLYLKHVRRPGIAVAMPTRRGCSVLMDVGANPAARPEHLLQYGVIGSVYAREILGIAEPRIGVMNIGSEEGKGNDLVRETLVLCQRSQFAGSFVGNVEGRDLYEGTADVIICEGFVGNVLLKAAEGLADLMLRRVSEEVLDALNQERDLAVGALRRLEQRFQYHESGGAPLLGVDGICIICHGSSNDRSIFNALKVAALHQARGINDRIVTGLAKEETLLSGVHST
jgi:phosphate acyltransferase